MKLCKPDLNLHLLGVDVDSLHSLFSSILTLDTFQKDSLCTVSLHICKFQDRSVYILQLHVTVCDWTQVSTLGPRGRFVLDLCLDGPNGLRQQEVALMT